MISKLRKHNAAGFSLVELMVVVAIIGILASVAIPNFQRFQRKARQSEAKAVLGGMYAAEVAFRSEWESYHDDLVDIGYAGAGTYRYDAGFTTTDSVSPTDPNFMDTMGAGALTTFCASAAFDPSDQCNHLAAPWAPAALAGSAITATTFTIQASGMIGGTTNANDLWSVNQAKAIVNNTDGTY